MIKLKNFFKTNKRFISFSGDVVQNTNISNDLGNNLNNKHKVIFGGSLNSYVPLAVGPNILTYQGSNFYIGNIDSKNNLITVGCDVKVYDLFNYLKSNNYYIKVLPGYSSASIGACVATNVHGKNQYKDDSFKKYIFELFIMNKLNNPEWISKNKNQRLFNLTVGGFGVTGKICFVTLKICKLPSKFFYNKTSLETMGSKFIKEFIDLAKHYDYVYTIHNLTKCRNFNKFIFVYGGFIKNNKKDSYPAGPLNIRRNLSKICLYNRLTCLIINKFIFRKFLKLNNSTLPITDIFFQ